MKGVYLVFSFFCFEEQKNEQANQPQIKRETA